MAKYRIPSDYKNQTPRATHNRVAPSYGTIHPGLAVPVHHRHLNVGERIRGRIDQLLQSQPMLGPLLNGFKLTTIATFLPDSAIYGWLRDGRRYTPDEYMNFGKVYYIPYAGGVQDYEDPLFGTRYIRPLKRGLPSTAIGSLEPYDVWVSDDFTGTSFAAQPTHVGRGGLWDWLGLPAAAVAPNIGRKSGESIVSIDAPSFKFNLAPFFTYVLSHYYYIANMQEAYMYFTRGAGDLSLLPDRGDVSNKTAPSFKDVFSSLSPDAFLDLMLEVNARTARGAGFCLNDVRDSVDPAELAVFHMLAAGLQGYGGLLSVPYSPDLFGNIIKQGSSPTAYVNVEVGVETTSGTGAAVPELRMKNKIQNWMDRLFISGGRPGDVFRTLWGTKSSPYINKPDFLGVWQASINPSNIRATANGTASGEEVNLGQLAACIDRYCDFSKHSGIDYYAKEPGTFMLITMLVPDPAYTQGLHPDLATISFADDFNPELNGIGFQPVPRHRFTMMPRGFSGNKLTSPWFDGAAALESDPNLISVGEEVAWSWLRTDYPRLHGEFAQNGYYQYWTLVRRFTQYFASENNTYSDYEYTGTYINPLEWQYIFVDQSISSPNFCYYGYFDLKVTSSLSANYMPYLGR